MREFNPALAAIKISPIVVIAEQAKKLQPEFEARTGQKFLHFERGDMDLPTPEAIIRDLKAAFDAGKTKYPKAGGEPEFRKALSEKVKARNGIDAEPDDIVVAMGGQEALGLPFLLFAGGTVAGFSPVWSVILENLVPYCSQKFIEVPFNADFSVNWNALEDALKKSDLLYLNTPQNPTGKVFSRDELARIAELCRKHSTFIVSDEAYEDIVYDGKKHISIASLPEAQGYDRIATAYTISKSFAATGLRVGYTVTKNKKAASLMKATQYTHTAGVPTAIQHGLVNAYKCDTLPMVKELQRRRDAFHGGLAALSGVEVVKPEGSFYFFPDFSGVLKKFPGKDIFTVLLDNGLCGVPGSGFTRTGNFGNHMRLAYSMVGVKDIETGTERMKTLFG